MAECLAGLEIDSLDTFAQDFDLEEGHESAVLAVLEALPTKPKRARQQRNRAQRAFADLVARLRDFEEFDQDDDGFLSRVECMRIPPGRMQAKAGGTVADHFDDIDTDRDGRITFSELFLAADLVEHQPPSLCVLCFLPDSCGLPVCLAEGCRGWSPTVVSCFSFAAVIGA